jgi:hypothetical protein
MKNRNILAVVILLGLACIAIFLITTQKTTSVDVVANTPIVEDTITDSPPYAATFVKLYPPHTAFDFVDYTFDGYLDVQQQNNIFTYDPLSQTYTKEPFLSGLRKTSEVYPDPASQTVFASERVSDWPSIIREYTFQDGTYDFAALRIRSQEHPHVDDGLFIETTYTIDQEKVVEASQKINTETNARIDVPVENFYHRSCSIAADCVIVPADYCPQKISPNYTECTHIAVTDALYDDNICQSKHGYPVVAYLKPACENHACVMGAPSLLCEENIY